MNIINRKSKNVLDCDCGNVIEYSEEDFTLERTDDSGDFYAIGVKCPDCGYLHILTPEKFESKKLLASFTGGKKSLDDYSFAEIKSLCYGSNVPFSVGDGKKITLKDGSEYVVEIIGFKHDELSDADKQVSGVTFCFRELLGKDDDGGMYMNAECTNKGGWKDTERRIWLNDEFFNLLPDDLADAISPVVKKTCNGEKVVETVDKIFLPSEVEIFGKTEYSGEGEGKQYEFFKYWRNRVKGYTDGGHGRWYWLRSPRSGYSTTFCIVFTDGSADYSNASTSFGVSPCFAL